MRKILLLILLVLFLAAAGVGIFIATFDADHYRPLVIQQLESLLGKSVTLEKIFLGWHDGIALRLKRLTIYPGQDTGEPPLLALKSASAKLELLPLLHRQIQVESVVLSQPELRWVRTRPRLRSLPAPAGLPSPATPAAKRMRPSSSRAANPQAAALLPFLVQSVKVENGSLYFRDETGRSVREVDLKHADISVKNVSLAAPIPFQAHAALLGERQNLDLTGQLLVSPAEKTGALESLQLKLDLGAIEPAELVRWVPALARMRAPLEGEVTAAMDSLKFNRNGSPQEFQADVHLKHGSFTPPGWNRPIADLTVDGVVLPDRIEIPALSADLEGAKLAASGVLENFSARQTPPRLSFRAPLKGLELQEMMPAEGRGKPQFRGRLSASLEGAAVGKEGPEISRTLTGSGQVILNDAAILNFNLLREIFSRLSLIPGLVDRLAQRLPQEYQAKLDRRDTILGPITLPFTLQNGALIFRNLQIDTDTFQLGQGIASIGLNGVVAGQIVLRIDPDLSAALIQSVREFEYLADRDGRLEIPIRIDGVLPHVTVIPDLQVVATRLAVSKTAEVLGNFLQKRLPNATGSGQPPTPSGPAPDPLAGLLENFLQAKKK